MFEIHNRIQKDKKEPKEHIYTATLRYTSPHFTQLHFTTLIDTSVPLTLHYPLIWLNPITFPTALFHLISFLPIYYYY